MAVFLSALVGFSPEKAQGESIAPIGKLVEKFEQTVFSVNLWGPIGLDWPAEPLDRVVKWQSRPIFSIHDDGNRLQKEFPEKWKFFDSLMIELTRLTDIWIRLANWETRNSTNFHLYYYRQQKIFNNFKDTRRWISSEWDINIPPISIDVMASFRCTSYAGWGKKFRINKGHAFVLQGLEKGLLRHCLLKSIIRAFGLFADSDVAQPSIFSKSAPPLDHLTLNDKIILRTLYDKRIKPGMAKDEAMKIAAEIIPELVAAVKAQGVEALYQQ